MIFYAEKMLTLLMNGKSNFEEQGTAEWGNLRLFWIEAFEHCSFCAVNEPFFAQLAATASLKGLEGFFPGSAPHWPQLRCGRKGLISKRWQWWNWQRQTPNWLLTNPALFFQLARTWANGWGRNKKQLHARPLKGFRRVAQTNYSLLEIFMRLLLAESNYQHPASALMLSKARWWSRKWAAMSLSPGSEKRRRPSLHFPSTVARGIEFPSLQQIGLMGSNFSDGTEELMRGNRIGEKFEPSAEIIIISRGVSQNWNSSWI